jgi:ribosomal protein S18 acetylase RimI-like enzyme
MVEDAEQANELGLPLVRGPFLTLNDARVATEAARHAPAPVSDLASRIASTLRGSLGPAAAPAPPKPPPIVVREYRSADGDGLRMLWRDAGFRSLGDDDAGLRAFAQRNPGSFLVAVQGSVIVGSAMGAWDGRRGWIYHVATAPEHRRGGLATRLVRQVEDRLAALGCRKVNVIVREENGAGTAFWEALGYTTAAARQMGRQLGE